MRIHDVAYYDKDSPPEPKGALQIDLHVTGVVTDSQRVDALVRAAEKIGNCEFILKK